MQRQVLRQVCAGSCLAASSFEVGYRDYLEVFLLGAMRQIRSGFGAGIRRCEVFAQLCDLVERVVPSSSRSGFGLGPLACQRNLAKIGVRYTDQPGSLPTGKPAQLLLRCGRENALS